MLSRTVSMEQLEQHRSAFSRTDSSPSRRPHLFWSPVSGAAAPGMYLVCINCYFMHTLSPVRFLGSVADTLTIKGKGKAGYLVYIAPLNEPSTYQRRFHNCGSDVWSALASLMRRKLSSAHSPRNGLWTRRCCQQAYYAPINQSCLYPVIHVPNYIDYYSFTDLERMDGWVGQGTQHAAL